MKTFKALVYGTAINGVSILVVFTIWSKENGPIVPPPFEKMCVKQESSIPVGKSEPEVRCLEYRVVRK